MKRKIINVLLSLFILASIASCGGDKGGKDDPVKPTPEPTPVSPEPTPTNSEAIEFKDKIFESEMVKIADKNKDGKVSQKEALQVSIVSVPGKGIRDLGGIEYFTGVLTLNIANNGLTSLDASKLTQLRNIQAYGNRFTKLDLTNCVALETSRIISADGKTAVPHFFTGGGDSFIKVATAKIAENLNRQDANTHFYSNEDGGNSIISFKDPVFASTVGAITGKPTGVPVSAARNLTGILNVSSKKITSLEGIEYFTGIEQIIAYDNSIEEVVIENLPNLRKIDLGNNKIKKITLRNLPNLNQLLLNNNMFTELVFDSELPSLNTLSITGNRSLTKLDVSKLVGITNLSMQDVGLSGQLDLRKLTKLTDAFIKRPVMVSDREGSNPNISSILVSDENKAWKLNDEEKTVVYNLGEPFAGVIINDPNLRQIINEGMPRDIGASVFEKKDLLRVTKLQFTPGGRNVVKDLTGWEECKNLQILFLYTTVEKIDLSVFPMLTHVEVSGPYIKEVNFGKAANLQTVKVTALNLDMLDLSGCPALTMVDISPAPQIKCVRVPNSALAKKFNEDEKNIGTHNDGDFGNGGFKFTTDSCQ